MSLKKSRYNLGSRKTVTKCYRMQVAHSKVNYFSSKNSISGLKTLIFEHEDFYVKVLIHHIYIQ